MKEFDIESFEDGEFSAKRNSKDIKNIEIDEKKKADKFIEGMKK